MKTILITGAGGQLGSAIKTVAANFGAFRFIYMDIQELDLTDDTKVQQYFKDNPVDFIINCAAFTAVDKAEELQDEAFQINGHVPELLGKICASADLFLIHISSDFVYDGRRSVPHVEEEIPLPLSVYAMSKLEGEKKLWDNAHAMVIRTSWLYSEFGNNFMKTMIRLMRERQELGIVFDQAGTPTYASDLALAILKIAEHSVEHGFIPGIYNYSNEGVCSWFDFAMAIKEINNSACSIKPIRTVEYPLPAKRPEYSVMDKSKIKRTFGITIPYWRDSLIVALQQFRNTTF
jgi:dTDP-4-dehydrorhamnose reductase